MSEGPDRSSREQLDLAQDSRGSFFRWLDRRTGIDFLLRAALDEPIPGGASLAYVFGSGLLFLFLSQVITGVFLALYYVPSADHAHTTVTYITKEVTAGSFIRSIHAYGSSAIVIVLLLHITQTFLWGSYKGRRELLWLAGCVLFALMLGMAFTGYLLPWDQKAFFATTVGTNILSEVPLAGNAFKSLLRGGTEMGTLTLSRFFVLHVFMIPALIFAFVGLHVYLFRGAGAAGPIRGDAAALERSTEPFYPRQVLLDLMFALVIIAGLGVLAHFAPTELGPRANPADTQYIPRPEWYYIPVFQWLKYWQGALAVVGILVIPGLIALVFAALPFFDHRPERRPWRRPVAVSLYLAIFVGLGALGALSRRSDLRDAAITSHLATQKQEVEVFMKAPFEPELMESPPITVKEGRGGQREPREERERFRYGGGASPDLSAKGKEIFEQQGCNACHGEGGVGSPAGPTLIGVGAKYQNEKLERILRNPTGSMTQGGMQPTNLNGREMQALIAYLESLQ